jgi:GNAT superfamily N-acetyltransferase
VIGVPLAADGSTAESPGGQGTLARLRAVLRSRKLARVHLAALAVAPAFSGRGIEAQLLLRAWRGALDLGIDSAELGGVDTEAPDTEALLWRLGAHRVRRYVIYQRELQ